jgi:catechol 2,3-dioxygenase-like lactoylglutathione lyase family enzyme
VELFAGIPVADFEQALDWYERLFAKPPDMRPHDREAVWNLTDHAWVYVVEDRERAGSGLVTLMVDDLDERVAALADRGIVAGPVESINEQTRSTDLLDPDGNRLQLGQAG